MLHCTSRYFVGSVVACDVTIFGERGSKREDRGMVFGDGLFSKETSVPLFALPTSYH